MSEVFEGALDAMLDGPLGADVVFSATEIRGILNKEYRDQDNGAGLGMQVWSTVLTVKDGALPASCREGSALTVGGDAYIVRKKGRVDDFGAREYFLAEDTT